MFTEFSMAWMTSSTDPVGLKSMIRPFLMISEQREESPSGLAGMDSMWSHRSFSWEMSMNARMFSIWQPSSK